MSNPKKKLPTGPIRISHPAFPVERSIQESYILEDRKQESGTHEALIPEATTNSDNLSPANLQRGVTETPLKQNSGKQENRLLQEKYKKATWGQQTFS